ncbi:MAG: SLC13 family permease [Pirellulaceae bacterium]
MNIAAWFTLGVVAVLFLSLLRNSIPTDLLFLGAVTILSVSGVITPEQAFSGFSNPGMLTVAFLFVVVAGLRETGILDYLSQHVLGKVKTARGVIARLAVFIVPMSAFMNNTPIVAMFVPIVVDWCRLNRVAASKLLIPVSFLTILGGTCTLIGTSTNLVINGLMIEIGMPAMGLFEIGKIGLPYAVVGVVYLLLFGNRLLPERKEFIEQLNESRRDYLVEMLVQSECRLCGKSVETAGLRRLPGLFLIEIDREGRIISPIRPEDIIHSQDRLVFAGIVSSIIELERIPGLIPVLHLENDKLRQQHKDRRLCEAVISESSALVGKTIRDADFREVYGAAVVAVQRFGKRIVKRIGDIELRPGDTLLMQTGPSFFRQYRDSHDFYLVSNVDEWRPRRRDHAWVSLALFLLLVIFMATGIVPIVLSAALTAFLMIALGCLSVNEARQSLEWQVLITIAASFAVGAALQNSGAATLIAESVVESTQAWGPIATLAAIYILGSIITEVITNNAAAVLMFPFCTETARLYDIDSRPFVIALALSASASFMTPIGYQTNMMVYGPGGYRFLDFMRIGAPLNVLLGIVAVVLIPWLWPF